jgi:membrane-bound serine protease (ClpP class)
MTLLLLLTYAAPTAQAATGGAMLLTINQAIGPATESYIVNGLQAAQKKMAALVIIRLDTPGGLETAMRGINQAILSSPIPVVAYVSPTGARAASAGTFILYASSLAAMAPGTNLGAATPVNLAGSDPVSTTTKNKIDDQNRSPLEHKVLNDAVASIQSLAQLHHRNAAWALLAVRDAASLSAEDALKLHVIDVIAKDIPDLLQKINGRTVIANNTSTTLQTLNLTVTDLTPDWRSQFLAVITNPNVAYLLLLLGIYGLFFEFYNPGMVLPGVVGAISLLVSLYAFEMLPVNYVGFALILLGITFLVIEILVSSFGILGLGGIVAFITGSIFLLDVHLPGYHIAWSLIMMMTIFSFGFLLLAVGVSVRALGKEIVSGSESYIGQEGIVLEYTKLRCRVSLHGENWLAHSKKPLQKGQPIRVLKVKGLSLMVEPLTPKINPGTSD